MKKYFSIGETAKINNVSIQALRLYDKKGLLKPAYVDPENNYRYYTIDQFMYLDIIRYWKLIGAPLKELSDILQNEDISVFLSFIKKQHKEVDKEIIRLKNISEAIRHIEDKIEYAMEITNTNEIFTKNINKRLIMDIALNKHDKESDIEIKLRKMDKVLDEHEIIFEGESGYIIDTDLFLKKGDMFYQSVYSTLCDGSVGKMKIDIKEIPGGNYICITYFNNERKEAVNKIRRYIIKNNINLLGTIVEAQLFNTLGQRENSDLLYELQILI